MLQLRGWGRATSILLLLSVSQQARAGLELEEDAAQIKGYQARWAIVVGINYDLPNSNASLTPQLKFAQSDAKEFHRLLIENYGFDPQHVALLLGADATRDGIDAALDRVLDSGAKEDDCVLLYFSGHGYGRPTADNQRLDGELLPVDVQAKEDGTPRRVVELDAVVRKLKERCKARHKLLILDCCHSGAVFGLAGQEASPFDGSRVDQSVFQSPGFQAMTASRDSQKAADEGGGDHSPFTDALLKAMQRLPPKHQKDGRSTPITTMQLFGGMQWYLDNNLPAGQSPRCAWLSGGRGEFHFFPQGSFPDPEAPDDTVRKVMVAMVPGSFGNWWFEETPWFMPGLRYEILNNDAEVRGLDLDMITPARLEQAARKTTRGQDARLNMRIKHLEKLLAAKEKEDAWKTAVAEVIGDLQATTGDAATADPFDVHYLAVLRHATRGQLDKQSKSYDPIANAKEYETALEAYQAKAEHSPQIKPLLALCLADRAWFAYDVERNYDEAAHFFAKARSVYGGITPQPFQIYVLCREAEALSQLGRTGAAKKRLAEATQTAQEMDPQDRHSLSAALYTRRAWLYMNWCEFGQAIEDFQKSTAILQPQAADNTEAKIICLHNRHGIAMAARFRGDQPQAVAQYRDLLEDLQQAMSQMREDSGRETNYRQTRARLVERWTNTYERIGDCSLFSWPPDAGEAADDYRRGLRTCSNLSGEKRTRWEQRLRYKWALALAMPNSSVQDLDLAEHQFRLIRQSNAAAGDTAINIKSIEICAKLTELLIAHCRAADRTAGTEAKPLADQMDEFRQYLSGLLDAHRMDRSLSRDDIEAGLFAMKVFLEMLPNPAQSGGGAGRVTRLEDIELLLGFCRLARRGSPESLAFVRPYYDCGIDSLIALKPKNSKRLIEAAWEAIHGKSHQKARDGQATLLLYCSQNQVYLFLDAHRGASSCYSLPAGIDLESLRAAADGTRERLALPDDLRKELSAINAPVLLCWRDSVNALGLNRPTTPSGVAANKPVVDKQGNAALLAGRVADAASQAYVFPFALPETVNVTDDQPGVASEVVVRPAGAF